MNTSTIYRGLRYWNDARAVRRSVQERSAKPLAQRAGRRIYGRLTGRLAGRLFR